MAAEHKCPVTTFPAFCYQSRCESGPCLESIEQELRFAEKFNTNTRSCSRWAKVRNTRRSQIKETEV